MFPAAATLEQRETKELAENLDLVTIGNSNSVYDKLYLSVTS